MPPKPSLIEGYEHYPRIEAAFQSALDESLGPRGPDFLYGMVSNLGLPRGASVLDLGCGEGRHSVELAARFGFRVEGIDPVPRHVQLSKQRLEEAARSNPELRDLVNFRQGAAEGLSLPDASIDLIWCREVLVLIEDLGAAFGECRRVLRPQGRMLIYQNCRTDRLEPREAELLGETGRFDSRRMEAAFAAGGFKTEQFTDLGSEIGEYIEETTGEAGRRLRHAARLLRARERYIAEFGQTAYDIMLGDCLWHVYRMIGKLSGRVYLLRIPDRKISS